MPFLNLRSHKKILVVDGRIGFTGGLNIGSENLVRSNPANPARDTHFEPPRIRRRLFGLSSGRHGGWLELGIVPRFGLCGRHVPDRLEEATGIVPVHPLQGGVFDRF